MVPSSFKIEKPKKGLNLLRMKTDRDPTEAESSLEFMLVTLSRSFKISAKQAASLMTNNNQPLIEISQSNQLHTMAPLVNWLSEVFNHSEFLTYILVKEYEEAEKEAMETDAFHLLEQYKKNFFKILHALSSGCMSRDLVICSQSLHILRALA